MKIHLKKRYLKKNRPRAVRRAGRAPPSKGPGKKIVKKMKKIKILKKSNFTRFLQIFT